MTDPYLVEPLTSPPDTTVVVPGSKSITNRALIAAALASAAPATSPRDDGRSHLTGALFADDTEAMIDAARALGAAVDADPSRDEIWVSGVAGSLGAGPRHVDARLSGTTARFVLPALLLGPGPSTLDGGDPLRLRPMADGIEALRALGATVTDRGEPGHLPVEVRGPHHRGGGSGGGDGGRGGGSPRTLSVRGDVSSQFLSGLLLVAPCLAGGLTIEVEGPLVSRPYVDLTVELMHRFGAETDESTTGRFEVAPTGYVPRAYHIEPDASAASYFFAAAALTGGRVRIEGLGADALQGDVAFVDVLERMGAEVTREPEAIEVRGTGTLRGIDVDMGDISDTAQTLAAVAVFADGPTEVRGIGFIRRKETDRIAAVVTELRRCGIEAREIDDGFRIVPATPRPAVIETYDDHRMAMSFALLGLRTPGIEIADPACVAKTFPDYFATLDELRRG